MVLGGREKTGVRTKIERGGDSSGQLIVLGRSFPKEEERDDIARYASCRKYSEKEI